MPAHLKDSSSRARRNKSSTRTTLEANIDRPFDVPELPELDARVWHPLTLQFWEDTWNSPMSTEYLIADIHGLYRLAVLVDQFWIEPKASLSAEIRLMQQPYGLTPLDRRRLEWSVEQTEDAKSKGTERRRRSIAPEDIPKNDPRGVFAG